MDASDQLQSYSFALEGAVGLFDKQTGGKIRDEVPISIFERLLDKYYFKDGNIRFESELLEDGFNYVQSVIENDLKGIDEDELVKVLGVLHFVAKRRTRGHREYLRIVEQFVGERMGPGMRVMKLPPDLSRDTL
jgi:hypothetical protein